MSETGGFLQLDRCVDSITVGARHRKDLGDIAVLPQSIAERDLLQPITITPDGALVCGLRRLEAIKRLGWRTTNVWVRRVSDDAHRLLAEQDENAIRKPYSDLEADELYREIKTLLAEESERHQAARVRQPAGGVGNPQADAGCPIRAPGVTWSHGVLDSSTPRDLVGNSRKRAALLVTGRESSTRMEQIGQIRELAADPAQPRRIRDFAHAALEHSRAGNPVNPAYQSVQAALGKTVAAAERPRPADAELEALAQATLERVKASPQHKSGRPAKTPSATTGFTASRRMWILTFRDLDGWLGGYDPADLATSVTANEWATFTRVAAQIRAFELAGEAARAAVAAAAAQTR